MKDNFIRKLIFKIRDSILPKTIGSQSWNYISQMIESGSPMMLCRFGAVEIKAMCYSKLLPWPINLLAKNYSFTNMHRNAGFFPTTKEAFSQFSDLIYQDCSYIDVLASWRIEEILIKNSLKSAFKCGLADLNPHLESSFWLQSLKGKRVLVVHPFATTIESQYRNNRTKLYSNPDFLPEFASLETVKAIQTIAGNEAGFKTWFDALEYMKKEIEKHDFDVCLLGCGAYGFPLAAHIKRMGKQGIHVGGVLQIYFGIKGKRWDDKELYNEFWVSPSDLERPEGLKNVENGCYW